MYFIQIYVYFESNSVDKLFDFEMDDLASAECMVLFYDGICMEFVYERIFIISRIGQYILLVYLAHLMYRKDFALLSLKVFKL